MSHNSKREMGQRIAFLRKEKNMSQSETAKYLNISTSALSMYETGNREPNNELLSKLADFFGVSTDYLLGRESPKNNSLNWQDLGMAYGGRIPDDLKDMYRAIAEEYVRKHPDALDKND